MSTTFEGYEILSSYGSTLDFGYQVAYDSAERSRMI